MEQIKIKQSGKFDLPLTIVSLAILFTFVGLMFAMPDATLDGVNTPLTLSFR